jgi:N-acetylmuramoyl-L-alanine amidase
MRIIKNIILHCSSSPNGKAFSIRDCDSWHLERGFHRSDGWREHFNPDLFAVGYHFWIGVDGVTKTGRDLEEIGAHVSGLNATSIGVCMCGTDKFSQAQWEALSTLILNLRGLYPAARIIGHYETPTGASQGKTCPNFNVPLWLAQGMIPDTERVI